VRALRLAFLLAVPASAGCTLVLDRAHRFDAGMHSDGLAIDVRHADSPTDSGVDMMRPCDAPDGCCETDLDCTPPASCVAGACRIGCGAPGEACCEGLCAGSFPCRADGTGSNWCAPCGGPGEVCCLGMRPCREALECTPIDGVSYCIPVSPVADQPGGACTPLPASNCVDLCGVDPCGKTARCEPTAGDAGVCIACGLPGQPCCSGMLIGLPFYCPGITRCADQQSRTALCVPM
jgi:hypothetical protein